MNFVKQQTLRGQILHFTADPFTHEHSAYEYFDDGLLWIVDGKINALGHYQQLIPQIPDTATYEDWRGCLIIPGFIDTHIHYSQVDVLASPGKQLLDWLNDYTFVEEQRFVDATHCQVISDIFLDTLLRHGTTTAHVFATVHAHSADIFLQNAEKRNLRMIAGKVWMDRNAPPALLDNAQSAYDDTLAQIKHWHGRGRIGYSITPRFAPTSTEAQLEAAGVLAKQFPDVNVHTHVAENHAEIAWVKKLFPKHRSYLDVYQHYGLLRKGCVLAHCIWLAQQERKLLAELQCASAFCPSSNLFLGSGLYPWLTSAEAGLLTSLATDVGGGFSYNMLRTMACAYAINQLQGNYLSALQCFYMANKAGAMALNIDDKVGDFQKGKEADIVVLSANAIEELARRSARAQSLEEKLFALMMLGDERCIKATYSAGTCVYRNKLG